MSAHDIETEFAPRGVRHGHALLLEERAALALIDRAAQHGVAIVAVDLVRRDDVDDYATLKGEIQDRFERTASWDEARTFIRALTGRGLLFEVVLEDRPRARLVRPKGFITAADTHVAVLAGVFLLGIAVVAVFLRMTVP